MAYKKADLEKKALAAIKRHKLVFVTDVVSYLPCSRSTFYDMGLDKSDNLKSELEKQRTSMKVQLRKRWLDSDNPTLNVALYKLIGNEDEAHRLNGSKQQIDHTTGGQPFKGFTFLDGIALDPIDEEE